MTLIVAEGFMDIKRMVIGHMKNHVWVDGQLRQTNKQFSDLKQKQKEQITQWMREKTGAFYRLHQRYPVGRQSEDVVDNVYASIERAGIWIPYGEVYQHYISIKTRLINRLKAKESVNQQKERRADSKANNATVC